MTSGRRSRGEASVVIAAFLLLQGLLLLTPELGVVDPEEGMTPVQATALGWIPWSDLLRYQYRPFCGGCTLAALAYRPILWGTGDTVLGWKLVLVPFQLAWLLGGAGVAQALGGRWGRRAFEALACLSPWLVAALGWRGWTNHFEATAVGLVGAALILRERPRPWLGGAALGLAVVVGLSGLVTVLATLTALVGAGRRDVAVRAAAAGTWAVVPWGWLLASTPLDLPTGSEVGVAARAAALLDPLRIGATLGSPDVGTGLILAGVTTMAVIGLAARGGVARLPAVGIALWSVAIVLGGVELLPIHALRTDPLLLEAARYGVVPAMLGLVAVGAMVGRWVEAGRRTAAGALLLAALTPGLVARAALVARDDLTADPLLHAHAPAWDTFRLQWLAPGLQGAAWRCGGDAACLALTPYRVDLATAAPPAVIHAERLLATVQQDGGEPGDAAAAWALGRSALRLPLGPRPVPSTPALAVPWARGYGQSWGSRRGVVDLPPGSAAWSPDVRAAFAEGVADGHATPWWPRYGGE